ncbi:MULTISPECIES: GNAT family N-acetyltransferase [unclassified Paenibacillus]|uniref:GNAT family N-acetyltransferase n=1 Tax=unclassified Paenibacillus TaxID=185978 RepID=UPI00278AB6CE|nr:MULTISPECIES: GNAT family protein [unclassified Paenibacillus]MDQ0899253.1 RimJ/RimL family protein N-acetyltransferase [Paenibacillus sp. V4I7]MDQ0914757.1 RimJ/RimL family protein N-acetyltransferase [Paenibacillus sp. V4I5]
MNLPIQGSRLLLRDLTEQDIERIYYWDYLAEDREHLNWNGPYKPLEPLTLEDYYEKYKRDLGITQTGEPRYRLVIEIDGELKGITGRYWVDESTNWFEIGIAIFDSRYWSGGYGTEVFQMWIDYLFTQLKTVRLGIGTWSGNERMIRLAAKCGMIEEARVRKARIVRGEYYDAIKMGILREEWEHRKHSLDTII